MTKFLWLHQEGERSRKMGQVVGNEVLQPSVVSRKISLLSHWKPMIYGKLETQIVSKHPLFRPSFWIAVLMNDVRGGLSAKIKQGGPYSKIMRKFQINVFCSILTLSLCGATLARPKEFRKLVRSGSEFVPNESKVMSVGGEPTCEELRAMWRFSRRQSRAAEITNEIPTYRDPFAYNVWEHYPKVRSVLGTLRSPARPWSRPIYGRIVQHAPSNHPRVLAPETRAYDEVLRYVDNGKPEEEPRRRPQVPTYRLSGGQAQGNRLSRTGSFQHLKELIWAERAKELHQQRLLEEVAAKSAAERNAQQYNDNSKGQSSNYKYIDQDAKAARLRLLNGETDLDAVYGSDSYIKPYHPRSAFNSESSNERLW